MYQPGDILLGKYRIDALAGQGAFAHVYRATHLSLDAPRALKVLRRDAPGIGSTEFADYRARFQLEAQLGAALDHPHVIRVHDFEQDGGTLILVMEYAAGGSLVERIAAAREAGGFIPIDEVVRIAREAAAGLAALHAQDIVHRDVKPSNLLFDDKGRIKVSDLGLAQIPHGPSQRSLGGSLATPHPGTPAYMSPEQQFTTAYLPPASDVYSLGVVLFEMLTGRAYKNLKPGTPLSKVRWAAPAWLDEIAGRMLADDPRARPWDGAELLTALEEGQRIAAEQRVAAERARAEAEQRAQAEAEAVRQAEQRQKAQEAEQARRQEAQRQAEAKAQAEAEARTRAVAEAERQRIAREAEAARQAELKRTQEKAARPQPVWRRIGIELIKIPAGEFLYGDDEQKVTLPEYWIAKTPVTNAQYKAFVDATGHSAPSHWSGDRILQGKENHPVVRVSWDDAQEFCAWAGLRLPAERKWEKAARGTDGRAYPWGYAAPTDKLCNFNQNVKDTTPVGRYSPAGDSPYGLVDMAGNVWEWCSDWYDSKHKGRVLRGGSWLNDQGIVRAANRNWFVPDIRLVFVGFRCARS